LILQAIVYELGVKSDAIVNKLTAMHRLQEVLMSTYKQGRRVVVLVEEAQGMPIESLEELRLLSNLEVEDQKLMQIVLFGQPELDSNLALPQIRQLRERIIDSVYLQPFDNTDVHDYLNFRLRSAGYHGPDLFSKNIAKLIRRYSGGLTRRVNVIADKILILMCSHNRFTIRASDVKKAAQDCEFSRKNIWWFKAA
jgi:type II secretory pathway predicted ATPase ExeA